MAFTNPQHDNLPVLIFELFMLSDGEKKITENVFTRMSNTSDFIILKEDHTLGNVITEFLRSMPHVMMAAYKIAHPNVPEVLLRIQTDGTMAPRDALADACKSLVAGYGHLGREFQKEFAFRQIADQGEQANANGALNGAHY